MSLLTDLQAILTNTQQRDVNAHNHYMLQTGPTDLKTFFRGRAQVGESRGMLHVEKGKNPKAKSPGYATLSGELAIINADPSRGIVERNEIGWFYFNMENASTAQFQTEVTDLITYLTTEGLTIVNNVISETMADITVSWE